MFLDIIFFKVQPIGCIGFSLWVLVFAGATIARMLAENGYKILLIDKRNHLGGNAYDYVNSKSERIHKYGPHLFHCNHKDPSLKFLNRFTEWIEYKHKVRAILENGKTTLYQ